MGKFHEMVKDYESQGLLTEAALWAMISDIDGMLEEVRKADEKKFWKFLSTTHERFVGKHYNEAFAKARVATMWHCADPECREKDCGEQFTMEEAGEFFRKYKTHLPAKVNQFDFYVAINAQAHDYHRLIERWFEDGQKAEGREKIVEMAVEFWFCDKDYPKGADVKVWEYFEG